MPESPHEALHQIFREDTSLICRVLQQFADADIDDPTSVTVLNVDLTEFKPLVRFTDTALMCEWGDDKHIFIVESQTEQEGEKRAAWPYYVAYLHNKYNCPVTLVVLCSDQAVARWAKRPIVIGLSQHPSMVVTALAFGPKDIAPIADPDEASKHIQLAVFSTLIHRKDTPTVSEQLDALAEALATIDTKSATHLAHFTGAGLGPTMARQIWSDLMNAGTHQYQSDFTAQWEAKGEARGEARGEAKGRAKGEAQALLRILDRRDIPVDETSRTRILACDDLEQLGHWIDRALTATSIDELFT
ncbi:hypothetical protein J4H86_05915 [Spiractinospora alimapuensis]|uniref:hypothetical protein n=1 Tax=Spiractinospora alimapuensis TaxID=2820884 RepID=UPI001F200943|nr:hypothetical protein [Spiractinospora alimapuensis]QVQ53303.1 hypothetical protein J4H86_05915 [Spiractinospora alimapuensis]